MTSAFKYYKQAGAIPEFNKRLQGNSFESLQLSPWKKVTPLLDGFNDTLLLNGWNAGSWRIRGRRKDVGLYFHHVTRAPASDEKNIKLFLLKSWAQEACDDSCTSCFIATGGFSPTA